MMKTNARETRRFPAGSIGTGRHSARIAKQKNITIPSTERGLGCDMTAVTAAPATTGAPTTHVAKTYQCSRDGNVRAESERRRMSFRQAELVRLLRPAGARAAGDGERRKRGDRNRSPHVPSLPTNHRRASSIKVAKHHRSRRTKGFRTTPRITRAGDHASPAAVIAQPPFGVKREAWHSLCGPADTRWPGGRSSPSPRSAGGGRRESARAHWP